MPGKIAESTKIRYTPGAQILCGEFETILTLIKTKENKKMKNNKTLAIALGGVVAAMYVVLTFAASAFGLASGAIQVRLSEALTILPVFSTAAIPGLTVGCVLANLLTGCAAWDVVFGSLATMIGAFGTRLLRRKPFLAWIPPVLSNMVIIPVVLMKVYGVEDITVFGQTFGGNSIWLMLAVTVGIGEVISCGILGLMLYKAAERIPMLGNMIQKEGHS